MVWPEDIARELPEPHPEEPARLRSDILDELYDHLQSSLEHEQLTKADADAARESVLARFGNPATIACRLWWDAMWGRIMLQRITLVFVALLCCVSIVMTFMVWQAIENSQQAIANSQQATAALVEQVQKLAEREVVRPAPEPVDNRWKYVDWIPVSIKLQYENGEPVSDPKFRAKLSGQRLLGENSRSSRLEEHPAANGLIDFGLVKPGDLSLDISTPWSESIRSRHLVARPGQPIELTVTCPRLPRPVAAASFQTQWPEDLQRQGLWFQFILQGKSRKIGGDTWLPPRDHRWSVIVDPQNQVHFRQVEERWEWNHLRATQYGSTSYVPEVLSHLLLGTPLTDEPDKSEYRGRTPFGTVNDVGSQDLAVAFNRTLSQDWDFPLDEPVEQIEIPTSGVFLQTLRVLRKDRFDPGTGIIRFENVLPVDFSMNPFEPDSQDWTYRPSDLIVELVRKRLEQIEAKAKPREEDQRDAAGVSAETN